MPIFAMLAALVCVAAYSPSKAVEPECVEPRSTCATQQTAANKHFQEMAIAAANHMGLCTATEADTRNNDGGATPGKDFRAGYAGKLSNEGGRSCGPCSH
jgi:hypothetical protein